MMFSKSSVLLITAVVGYALAAPKPITLEEVGRGVKNFGEKALPIANGMCKFLNSFQGYPMGYPQFGFPQGGYPGYYPYPGFQYPANNPAWNVPSSSGTVPSGGAFEQDDLNSGSSYNHFLQSRPPQLGLVQAVESQFKEHDLPANIATHKNILLQQNLDQNTLQ